VPEADITAAHSTNLSVLVCGAARWKLVEIPAEAIL
jgi:hypothetical protein